VPGPAPAPVPTDTVPFLDSRARVLASGDDTDGGFGLVEMTAVPAGSMPPLHVHHRHDEGFFVLEGSVTLFVPGAQVELGVGDFYIAPRGVPHTYRVGDTDARWLCTSSPAGFERFVAGVAALGTPDPDSVNAVAAANDIEILGPPGTLP
jgi:mannose-6-phosphate isomerase-like protein (cupin superfamily)